MTACLTHRGYSYAYHCLLFVLSILGCYGSLGAQKLGLSFNNYTTDDGLPSNECYDILQDSKDYIWISTDNGISRFDGYEFKNFGPAQGLMDKTILFMQEDHRGWIWLCAFPGAFYIIKDQVVETYEYNHIIELYKDRFYNIVDFWVGEDEVLNIGLSDEGFLIIQANGEHEFLFDETSPTGTFVYLQLPDKILHGFGYRSAAKKEARSKSLFDEEMGKRFSILSFVRGDSITNVSVSGGIEVKRVKTSILDRLAWMLPNNQILVQYLGKIYILDAKTYEIVRSVNYPAAINYLLLTQDGELLIGHSFKKGLAILDSLEALMQGKSPYSFFDGYTISHLSLSVNGDLWVSTIEDGVFHINDYHTALHIFRQPEAAQHLTLAALPEQQIAIAQSDGSIIKYDLTNGDQTIDMSQSEGVVNEMVYIPDRQSLFISSSLNLQVYEDQFFSIVVNRRAGAAISGYTVLPDPHDPEQVFVGSNKYWGMMVLRRTAAGWEEYGQRYMIDSIRRIVTIVKPAPDLLLVGTDIGIFAKSLRGGDFYRLPFLKGLDEEEITKLYLLDAQRLLIGTKSRGLLAADLEEQVLLPEISLPTIDRVEHLTVDDKGNVWLATPQGITILRIEEGTIAEKTHLSQHTGLPSNEVRDLKTSKDGVLALFKHHLIQYNSIPEVTYIDTPPILQAAYYNQERLDGNQLQQLNWHKNNLQLHFNDLDYRMAGNQQFRYRLDTNQDWVNSTSNRINLFNLDAEEHTVEVQSQKIDGSWSPSLLVPINIIPAIWQRFGFWIALGLLILAIVLFQVRTYIKNLQRDRQRLRLEEEVNALQQQAYRAQMNPHFIFNCLNAIQGLVLGEEEEQEKANLLLADFSMLIRRALDASRKDIISMADELALVRNYLELERMRFDNNFDYEIIVDMENELEWIYVPPMIIQPFVENAVLHGMANRRGDGFIRLTFTENDAFVDINIWDNGPGISTTQRKKPVRKQQHPSLGMDFTERRIQMHNESSTGLKISEPTDGDGHILGTRIQFQLRKVRASTPALQ